MVEEAERTGLCQGDQPKRQLREFDGKWININAVQTPLGDKAPGDGDALLWVPRQRVAVTECLNNLALNRGAFTAAFGRLPR